MNTITRDDLRNVSISEHTLRTCDLLRAFCQTLDQFYQDSAMRPADAISEASTLVAKGEENWTEDEKCEADFLVNETLWDHLDTIAPEGYYFGAHPGNGSDFGFWCEYPDGEPISD